MHENALSKVPKFSYKNEKCCEKYSLRVVA